MVSLPATYPQVSVIPNKPRLLEIDRMKGVAILFVMLIHSRPLADTLVHDIVINRAVPMFVVLFGLNSYLWWDARSSLPLGTRLRDWYVSRFWRLMPPVWGMLALWWPLQLWLWDARLTAPRFLVATFVGYLPWIGGGWFVTAIIGLVLVYPLFLPCFSLLGLWLSSVAGLAATFSTGLYRWSVVRWMQALLRHSAPFAADFYIWVFPPIFGWHVAAGALLSRYWTTAKHRVVVAAAMLGLAMFALQSVPVDSPFFVHSLQMLVDVPVAVLSLWVMWWIPQGNAVDSALRWLGVRSWGLYLGQLLIHNAFWMAEVHPYEGPIWMRWIYFSSLLGGAIVLAEAGQRVRLALGGWASPR